MLSQLAGFIQELKMLSNAFHGFVVNALNTAQSLAVGRGLAALSHGFLPLSLLHHRS